MEGGGGGIDVQVPAPDVNSAGARIFEPQEDAMIPGHDKPNSTVTINDLHGFVIPNEAYIMDA